LQARQKLETRLHPVGECFTGKTRAVQAVGRRLIGPTCLSLRPGGRGPAHCNALVQLQTSYCLEGKAARRVPWLCTRYKANHVPLPVIMGRLGHSLIKTTINRYGHLMPDLDATAADAMEQALAR
jgi:hypothetical protein